MPDSKSLDVIVRFHDLHRIVELRRCLFSLVCQSYRPLTIHIVTQRFNDVDISEIHAQVDPTLAIDASVALKIWNYMEAEPVDARSALLNFGIANANGRYLALLDHDDTIYPEAYDLLTTELQRSGAAIAFGGIASKVVEILEDAVITESRRRKHTGTSLPELFVENFCPIHSFVLDREAVNAGDVWFSTGLTRLEDYDFLLRITAKYPSSFRLIGRVIGDYYFNKNGTNTTCLGWNDSFERRRSWELSRQAIEERRKATLVSATVQKTLGWRPVPGMTINKAIKRAGL